MPTWVRIKGVLEYPDDLYGDITKREVEYRPDEKKRSFTCEETGSLLEQDIYSERNHRYLPVLFEGRVYLVSKSVTCHSLILDSMDGYKNATTLLRRFARLYSNDSMRAEGFIWDEETIQIMNLLPNDYRIISTSVDQSFWTAIKECVPNRDPFMAHYGVYTVTGDCLEHKTLYTWGGRYGKQGYPVKAKLRPLIRLDPDTMVDVEGILKSPTEPLKLCRFP